jgi:predicted Zn-dependent protease
VGQAERSILELKRARALDPLSLAINSTLGRVYGDAHRFPEAIEQCQNTLHLAPKFSMGHWCLAQAYVSDHRYALALPELELANSLGSTPLLACDLGCLYARMGRRMEAQTILLKLQQKAQSTYVSPYLIAAIYGALGETDRAFALLDRAYSERDPHITYLALDPRLDGLRSDRRFLPLVQRLKLPR